MILVNKNNKAYHRTIKLILTLMLKICKIIELTWPCEENVEVWHQKKMS